MATGFAVQGILWQYDNDANVWRSSAKKWTISGNDGDGYVLHFPSPGAAQKLNASNLYEAMFGAVAFVERYNFWRGV